MNKTQQLPTDHTEGEAAIDIPSDLRLAVAQDAPDFEEIILARKKLLAKVEKFEAVEDIDNTVGMDDAKRLRLDLVKCRTGLDRIRKEVGSKWRKRWEAINETFRPLLEENESAEKYLKESEDFAIIYEATRKAELRDERAKQLQPYTDPSVYQLGELTEVQFQSLLTGARLAFEAEQKAAEERRQREEEEKQAHEKERQRLLEENRLFQLQRQKDAEALRKQQEEANEERRKREALEAQQRAQEEEKRKAEEAERKVKAKAARAPDKAKLQSLLLAVGVHLEQLPKVKDEALLILDTFEKKLRGVLQEFADKIKTL